MAKTKEEMQDTALRAIDRINKNNKTVIIKSKSLKEQLKELERYTSLSDGEKLKEMPFTEWVNLLRIFVRENKQITIPSNALAWILSKKDLDIKKFHLAGTPFKTIINWMEDYVSDFNNIGIRD